MRISTTQIYGQGLRAFGVQQTKLAHLQEQISTGHRVTKPSDDPAASARILELEQVLKLTDQYQTNINLAENRLGLEETTVSAFGNVLHRARELALQANNATQDSISRNAIAYEIDELRNQLTSLANTKDANGDYLFAGHQSKSQPFTENTTGSIDHINFNGDQGERLINISQSRQMNIDTQGRDLFMQVSSATALNEATTSITAAMAPAEVFDNTNYVPGTYTITFSSPTVYSVSDGANVVASGTYTDSQDIEFMGIRTSITGSPAGGDTFTISQGQYKDAFSVIASLSDTLKNVNSAPATVGSYTFGSAVGVSDYSGGNSAAFNVDGNAVLLNADYTDLNGVVAEIQADLDATAGVGVYAVSNTGTSVNISTVATGISNTAPVVNGFASVLADFTAGGVAVNGNDAVTVHPNIDQAILDIDTMFNKVLEAKTSIGGRLNALEAQYEDNEAQIIVTKDTIGTLRDVDLAEAISQLSLEQTTLDAAQAVFSRITSSSLFNYMR